MREGSNSDQLFVFSIDDSKQNATSLLTPVSNIVFDVLSSGTLGFALHGSSVNHFLIGGNSSTANQILSCKWLLKLPWRAKPRVSKLVSKVMFHFLGGHLSRKSIKKTNSERFQRGSGNMSTKNEHILT